MLHRRLPGTVPPVVFGRLASEHLAIRVLHRLYHASDYWDGNWVSAEIGLRTRASAVRYQAALRADELERLRDELRPVRETLRGRATFRSMEGWLTIDVEGDGLGHADVTYVAAPGHASQTVLTSSLRLDRAGLSAVIERLDDVLAAFPVVGERPGR